MGISHYIGANDTVIITGFLMTTKSIDFVSNISK